MFCFMSWSWSYVVFFCGRVCLSVPVHVPYLLVDSIGMCGVVFLSCGWLAGCLPGAFGFWDWVQQRVASALLSCCVDVPMHGAF